MTNLTVINHHGSPFDSIRRFTEDGQEYWTARDLMPMLGYVRWDRVPEVIERARIACKNSGIDKDTHIRVTSNLVKRKQGGGSDQQDYHLTRYACYLVAMNGDPRKEEVSAAQTYFAIKTREAEVAIPVQNDRIKELELELALRKAEQKLLDTRNTIVNTCPESVQQRILGYQVIKETEVIETVIDRSSGESSTGVGITYIARRLGFKTTAQCWHFLESIGYGKNSGKWKDELIAQHSPKLSRDDLYVIEQEYPDAQRQLFLGE